MRAPLSVQSFTEEERDALEEALHSEEAVLRWEQGDRVLSGVRWEQGDQVLSGEAIDSPPNSFRTLSPGDHDSPDENSAPWRPFVNGLRRFIAQRVPSTEAEDVLQDALLRLHEAAGSLRDADRAESWVFSIARHTIADFYRDRERKLDEPAVGRAPETPEEDSAANLAPYDGEHDVHEEVLSWLRPMVEELPEKYRRPLVMADFEGHTHQAVADEIGLSRSGATSRIRRARTKLRERLEECCEVEFGPEGKAVAFRRRDEDA